MASVPVTYFYCSRRVREYANFVEDNEPTGYDMVKRDSTPEGQSNAVGRHRRETLRSTVGDIKSGILNIRTPLLTDVINMLVRDGSEYGYSELSLASMFITSIINSGVI